MLTECTEVQCRHLLLSDTVYVALLCEPEGRSRMARNISPWFAKGNYALFSTLFFVFGQISVQEMSPEICWIVVSYIKTAAVNCRLYLRASVNLCPYLRQVLSDFTEIRYKVSAHSAAGHL
jgi:hypothetical protein